MAQGANIDRKNGIEECGMGLNGEGNSGKVINLSSGSPNAYLPISENLRVIACRNQKFFKCEEKAQGHMPPKKGGCLGSPQICPQRPKVGRASPLRPKCWKGTAPAAPRRTEGALPRVAPLATVRLPGPQHPRCMLGGILQRAVVFH